MPLIASGHLVLISNLFSSQAMLLEREARATPVFSLHLHHEVADFQPFPPLCSPEQVEISDGVLEHCLWDSNAPFMERDSLRVSPPHLPVLRAFTELPLWGSELRRSVHSCTKGIEGVQGRVLPSSALG